MKFNYYSIGIFFLIFILAYPLIFKFSEKKITSKNNSEIKYTYSQRGFINIKNFDDIIISALNKTTELNNNFFKGKGIVKFYPKSLISLDEKKIGINASNLNLSENISNEQLNKHNSKLFFENVKTASYSNQLILIVDEEVVYFIDLRKISQIILNTLNNFMQKTSHDPICSNIDVTNKDNSIINYYMYQFSFDIEQKLNDLNKKFVEKEVPIIFQKCLRQKFDFLSDELKIYMQDYYKLHKNSFNLTLMRTINEKILLNKDEQEKLKFVNEISSFNDNLSKQLKK